MGVVSAGAALGLGERVPLEVIACGAAGASMAAAIRALVGDSPASLTGAIAAPLLMIAMLFDPAIGGASARAWIAIAAACWTMVELARPTTSPLVALLPATVAGVLDPSFVAVIAVAGARLMTAPWERPRWAISVPIAGGLIAVLALLAGVARTGSLLSLGTYWCGLPAHPVSFGSLASLGAQTIGPVAAVAALAGIVVLVRRRYAELAAVLCGLGALLVAMRTGVVGPAAIAIASLSAGLAVGRFAGTIRLPAGQALAGATASLLLLLPPAWTAIEHGERVSNVHASR
jgi:hypothetical protein